MIQNLVCESHANDPDDVFGGAVNPKGAKWRCVCVGGRVSRFPLERLTTADGLGL